MFRDREDAGRQLADQLKDRKLRSPLVLAIPRGGVPVGAVLAEALNADLDVVLSRLPRSHATGIGDEQCRKGAKSRTLALDVYWTSMTTTWSRKKNTNWPKSHRARLFARFAPQAKVSGRSVIVTDDGIATGSTMIAALSYCEPSRREN